MAVVLNGYTAFGQLVNGEQFAAVVQLELFLCQILNNPIREYLNGEGGSCFLHDINLDTLHPLNLQEISPPFIVLF